MLKRSWTLHFIALIAVFALVAGCPKKSASTRTQVAVSIFPIYDLTRTVAGPDADVVLLLPPGKSEHTFDPTPRDIERVAACQLGVMVGLGLDPWMEKLVRDAAPNAHVLKVGDRVPTRTMEKPDVEAEEEERGAAHHDEHHHGMIDPHVWLDPSRARLIVKAIGEELARTDAAHAMAYRKRAAELDKKLEALDHETEKRISALNAKGIITFHGSFGYFAERYKLPIVAVIEPYPGSTPSGAYLKRVLDIAKNKDVQAIFSEPQLDPRPAKTIATEGSVALGVLDPVGGSKGVESYESLIRFNVAALEKALGPRSAATKRAREGDASAP